MVAQSKRTDSNADEIVKNIEIGCTRKRACALVGMSTDTLNRWEKANAAFAARLHASEAKRDRSLVLDIRQAAKKDWKAAAWLLERVAREDYGSPKIDVNLTVQVRDRAEKIAAELGLTVDTVMAEAEAVASGTWDTWSP